MYNIHHIAHMHHICDLALLLGPSSSLGFASSTQSTFHCAKFSAICVDTGCRSGKIRTVPKTRGATRNWMKPCWLPGLRLVWEIGSTERGS